MFVTAQQQAVTDAEALPNILKSNNDRASARIDLWIATRLIMSNWQALKSYIENAFIPEKVDSMLEAAGASLYKKAGNSNWGGTRSLIDAANNFITANIGTLTSDDNMPSTFAEKFQTDGNTCIALATIFAEADMAKEMATNAKTDANNNIYATVIRMMKDGKQIFKDAPAIKKQFTVTYLVSVNAGEGAASLTGYITNENNSPVQGAVVASIDGKYTATTNAKGRYRVSRISAGSYNFNITCPGYQTIFQNVEFTPGTASRANFVISNIMMKVA